MAELAPRLPDAWVTTELDPTRQARGVVTAFNLAWGGALAPELQDVLHGALLAQSQQPSPGTPSLTELYEQTRVGGWQETVTLGLNRLDALTPQFQLPPPPLTTDERNQRLAVFVAETLAPGGGATPYGQVALDAGVAAVATSIAQQFTPNERGGYASLELSDGTSAPPLDSELEAAAFVLLTAAPEELAGFVRAGQSAAQDALEQAHLEQAQADFYSRAPALTIDF